MRNEIICEENLVQNLAQNLTQHHCAYGCMLVYFTSNFLRTLLRITVPRTTLKDSQH